MTAKELNDNLVFLSSLRMLDGLVADGFLSEAEAERTKMELKHRLRPTLILA